MFGYFTLVALSVTGAIGIASLTNKGRYFLGRYSKLIFLAAIILIFSFSGYFSFKQYEFWLSDPLAKFLLPPYQNLGYFTLYSLIRFFTPYLVSLAFALLLLQTATAFNRKKEGVFFEKEEPYLAAVSLFLVGHPGWLVYLVILILIYFILHTSYFILQRRTARLPLYYLWAPTAFFVIILNEYWISHTPWWGLLSV
ncbi:MAG: hypothetical protein HYW38_00465 [Candidatus Colwellbacteria bacterium]|nr:hypothetical protein [Candidatus Colwellbacteria bacterium]